MKSSTIALFVLLTVLSFGVVKPAQAHCVVNSQRYCEGTTTVGTLREVYGSNGQVNLRTEPNPYSEVRFIVGNGTQVFDTGIRENEYYLIELRFADYGVRRYWVHKSYFATDKD